MNYADFKDYLISFLWKKGDTQLIANLDNLIRMGEAKLNRELRVERRHTSVQLIVTNQREQLPADYHSIRTVVDIQGNLGELRYTDPASLAAERTRVRNSRWLPIYSLEGNNILFVGPTQGGFKTTGPTPPANPQNGDLWARTTVAPGLYMWVVDPTSSQWVQLTAENATEQATSLGRPIVVQYQQRVPSFKDADTTWLTADYLDLYVYAVLFNTAPFLREDERIQVWQSMYQNALAIAIEESAHEQTRGVYASKPLPYQSVANRRRR